MIDRAFADQFARDWAQAWNDRDLDAILSFYADGAVLHSPRIAAVTGAPQASLAGKPALKSYWAKVLAVAPQLYFEVDRVLAGSDAVTVLYTNHRDEAVAETFLFNAEDEVALSIAAYG